jgi:hypothetical protein
MSGMRGIIMFKVFLFPSKTVKVFPIAIQIDGSQLEHFLGSLE